MNDRKPALSPLRGWYGSIAGVLIGAAYGMSLRLGTALHADVVRSLFPIMSLAFICLGPAVIGFLTIYFSRQPSTLTRDIFLPWPAVVLTFVIALLCKVEGAICIVFLAPIALAFGSVGGLLAGSVVRHRGANPRIVSCVAVLPLVCMALESRLPLPIQLRTVENSIVIHASPANVWQHIASVEAIAPSELQPTWTHRLGFPLPVAAVLSYPGVGGVRTATFQHGLTFYETVSEWHPEQQIAFSIRADTAHIPPTTLDEHVTIGGPYFDVLDGEYRIEPRPDGSILLHLTSHQRLSTDFNGYAGLWSDAVMSSLQQSILQVIQHRCESAQQLALRNTNP